MQIKKTQTWSVREGRSQTCCASWQSIKFNHSDGLLGKEVPYPPMLVQEQSQVLKPGQCGLSVGTKRFAEEYDLHLCFCHLVGADFPSSVIENSSPSLTTMLQTHLWRELASVSLMSNVTPQVPPLPPLHVQSLGGEWGRLSPHLRNESTAKLAQKT